MSVHPFHRIVATDTCDGSGDVSFTLSTLSLVSEIGLLGFYPTNQATVYTFSVTDSLSKEVFSDDGETCTGDCTFWGIKLPAAGAYTISVDGDVAAQSFTIQCLVR